MGAVGILAVDVAARAREFVVENQAAARPAEFEERVDRARAAADGKVVEEQVGEDDIESPGAAPPELLPGVGIEDVTVEEAPFVSLLLPESPLHLTVEGRSAYFSRGAGEGELRDVP